MVSYGVSEYRLATRDVQTSINVWLRKQLPDPVGGNVETVEWGDDPLEVKVTYFRVNGKGQRYLNETTRKAARATKVFRVATPFPVQPT